MSIPKEAIALFDPIRADIDAYMMADVMMEVRAK